MSHYSNLRWPFIIIHSLGCPPLLQKHVQFRCCDACLSCLVCCLFVIPIFVIQRKALKTTPTRGSSYGIFRVQQNSSELGQHSLQSIVDLYLPCCHVQLPNPLYHASSFRHLMNPESRKCGGVKIFFIFLPSLRISGRDSC